MKQTKSANITTHQMCAKSAKFNRFLYWLTHQYKNLLNFADLAQIWWVCYISGFCLFQFVSLKIFHMILCLQFLHTYIHPRSRQTPYPLSQIHTHTHAHTSFLCCLYFDVFFYYRIREFNEFFIFGKK